MTKLLALLSVAMLSLLTARTRAFSDVSKFELSPTEGGGGGRFFTGSPPDGYNCTVCHSGGATPNVQISGLPDVFEPGASYDVSITFDQPEISHSIALEFVNQAGTEGGMVAFAENAEVDPALHCGQDLTLPFAPYLMSAGSRTIVGLSDCGAAALRFRFTAPNEPRIAFALGMVTSNAKADTFGDGSLGVTKILTRVGEDSGRRQAANACSVRMHDPATGNTGLWLLSAGLMIVLSLRRRFRCLGRITVAVAATSLTLLSGCARVAPYERGTLARRDMELGENADLTAGEEHAEAYREGSSGGGAAKGGGCGCN